MALLTPLEEAPLEIPSEIHDADWAACRVALSLDAVLSCEDRTMLPREVVAILCCPEDHSLLTPADESLVAEANIMIHRGRLRNRAGRLVEHSLDAGLANSSGDMLYPIIEGIPVLVREEAIPLNQIARGQHGPRPTSPNCY
jgi:uncharacterized protein YbaR (Trm112 family)